MSSICPSIYPSIYLSIYLYLINSLTKLDLSYNQLKALPKEMEDLRSLEELDISHNRISYYPGNIYKLSELRLTIIMMMMIVMMNVMMMIVMMMMMMIVDECNNLIDAQLDAISYMFISISTKHIEAL